MYLSEEDLDGLREQFSLELEDALPELPLHSIEMLVERLVETMHRWDPDPRDEEYKESSHHEDEDWWRAEDYDTEVPF